jgi:phosphate transport system protein
MPLKKHTDKSYDAELEELRSKLLTLGGKVEAEIAQSMRALSERDSKIAEEVVGSDREVNLLELEVDESCRRLLALRQPAASDLRFITTALKIVVDLERIGDLAVNIAERSLSLMAQPTLKPLVDIPKMASLVEAMLLRALDAFVKRDADLARSVLLADDEVDHLRDMVYKELTSFMQRDPESIPRAVDLIFVARNLERAGDHATNIAEDVVYLVKVVDVRHHAAEVLIDAPME